MRKKVWSWVLGLVYIVAVAAIWIAASYIVQSVVDAGVSPFLITYICNSLFIVYLPVVEIGRWLEDSANNWFQHNHDYFVLHQPSQASEKVGLLEQEVPSPKEGSSMSSTLDLVQPLCHGIDIGSESQVATSSADNQVNLIDEVSLTELDLKRRWSRLRVARVSLLVCPFWFLAQLTFNLSLKYTTVTVSIFLILFFLLPPFSSRSNFIYILLFAVKYHSEQCIKLIHFFGVSNVLE